MDTLLGEMLPPSPEGEDEEMGNTQEGEEHPQRVWESKPIGLV